ncbi:MAG: type transport system ATP-binding protein [Thermoplasmata archaeon]|nr:type transport system ATP-binding protein [Thermoplasmata archaeon]
MAEHAIEVEGLSKQFGDLKAVQDVRFEVEKGEVFAFLGPNGAGKSTTIKMLCTLLRPTGGSAKVGGHDVREEPRAVRRSIGLVFQERTLDDQLTAEENLRFHAVLYGVPAAELDARIDRVLKLVDLAERRKDLVSTFSGGMARRLEVARALLHAPEVLFLDEPTVGLDPQTRAKMWKDVMRLRDEEGVTIFMTTHYMDEAEYADRIAIIDHGKIVAIDTPTALKARVGADTVKLATSDDAQAAKNLASAGYDAKVGEKGGVVLRVQDGEGAVADIVGKAGVAIRNVNVHRPSLDDVFLHFTGHEIRPDEAQGSQMMRAWMGARMGGR